MKKDDPFGFDISVSSAKKKNPRGRRGMSGASETSQRVCEHEGCQEAGKYRAPKSPDVLDDFHWFCQQHVREYNLKWNFFDGTTEAELNAQQSSDKVWEQASRSQAGHANCPRPSAAQSKSWRPKIIGPRQRFAKATKSLLKFFTPI